MRHAYMHAYIAIHGIIVPAFAKLLISQKVADSQKVD